MNIASFALLACLIGSVFAVSPEVLEQWQKFKNQHQRTYASEDEANMRLKIFVDNLLKIYKHNTEYEEGKHTYKKGVNQFTDMLHSEFLEKMTVDFPPTQGEKRMMSKEETQKLMSSPAAGSVDWREKGAVTPIKDQGQCGACWAFSATGSLEGQQFLKNGKLVSLSEQNLVDCTYYTYGCYGCGGGWPARAYDYIYYNGGIDTEEAYPYEARNAYCRFDPNNVGSSITGHVMLPEKNEAALVNAVSTIGPISILINAEGFDSYSSGIYYDPYCDPDKLGHAVLAVGYGTENGQDYWLVKNSWGSWWGEDGYIRIQRGYNMCGVASSAVYPTV